MISTRKKIVLLTVVLAFLLPVLFLTAHPARAEIVYEYDFEAGWDYWSADNGVWEVGEPTVGPSSAHSLPNCAATILDGNYPRYTDSRLISPAIDLPDVVANQEIVLRFYQWFSYYNEPYTTDDNGQVQVQFYENDVWSAWETIESVSFSSGAWSVPQCDLTAYAGKRVRIGFFHVDYYGNQGGESTGWYVDDILIEKRFVCLFDKESIEDFESGWGCWWADNGVWEVGEPTSGPGSSYSGLYCAGTVLDGNYPRYTDSRLISPPIDLGADCTTIYVRWWQWFSYNNEPYATDDRGQVQIQTYEVDRWSDWQTLSEVVFSSGDWTPGQHDLTAYAGKRVRIGFFHVDYYGNQGGESTGWYIDDFEIICVNGPPPPFAMDIKVNGSGGSVDITTNDSVSVTVELEDGPYTGVAVDWWIGALTLFGNYWCDSSGNWTKSNTPISYSQEPLYDLPETTLLDTQLPVGIYSFFFVLDDTPDGVFNPIQFRSPGDYVNVLCSREGAATEAFPDFESIFQGNMQKLIEE